MRTLKMLLMLLLLSSTSFSQKSITWYRITADTAALNYNPFSSTNTVRTGYYNVNPKTGEQFRYTGGTTWVKDSLFKSTVNIVDTTINNITNVTNTVTNVGGIRWVTDWTQFTTALNDPNVRSINLAANLTATSKAYIPTRQTTIKEIEGHGFEITIPATIDTGIIRRYPSLSEANFGIDQQLRVRNLVMRGAGSNMGIYLSSNYGAKFEGCRFYSFNTAMDLRWCMATVIDQCFFWENVIGVNLDYDRFTGGSNSTSQSNHSIVQNSKFRSKAGGTANIRVFGASGIQILHNIFEGPNGNYDVFFDDNGSPNVKEVYMYGNHVEHQPTIAAFYIKLKDGYAYCGGIYSQLDCTLIMFESSAYAKCIVESIPFLTSGTKFQSIGSGARWWFINMPAPFDPNTTTYWLGGVAPSNSRYDNWNASGQSPFLQLGTRRP
jgi:hypothetical protein